jgi:serine/threonine protein phosphatase 1
MKTFVISDIHGAHKALVQVLRQSNFNEDVDQLICLGDVADGYPEVKQCFDELLKIKNLTYIIGNHDDWFLKWATEDFNHQSWIVQGGRGSKVSYENDKNNVPKEHIDLLKNSLSYLETENQDGGKVLFTHGGFDPDLPIEKQGRDFLMWDRDLFSYGLENKYHTVFVGHSSQSRIKQNGNVICIDTAAGHGEHLTMLNLETGQAFLSDKTNKLYPKYNPRG